LYVVVETDPETGDCNVLFARDSMAQIYPTREAAERQREWYIRRVYVEDADLGARSLRIYRLQAAGAAGSRLLEFPLLRGI
jgi:hypothetical protein